MPIALKTEESIFAEALDKSAPQERAAYLDNVCGTDAALRARVENLLRSHEEAGSFLRKPLAATVDEPRGPDAAPLAERPGTIIGPYKLLQEIGAGGMGAVYMAEQQEPVRRMVALKIIKPGMDSGQVLARFEAERQALAMMDHPNIARVLDAGTTESGRPYFVMELVKGVPITKFCDENQLTLRERLELFVPVCQAVQHAHTKGFIHRDLKPSNVLVALYDDRPVPKVIDFGVAKATSQRLTERTLFTEFGSVIGTFEYMSPEQAKLNALDIDTRSDVYSLGVLLYELLTGSTPLERKRLRQSALDELLRMIREEEPPKPSTRLSGSGAALATLSARRRTEPLQLPKLVRGELDWIVMKALEKDRTRRYETANGLARDIQRHLADEPVEACPPSAGYKLRKFAYKYRTPLRVAGAFLLLLVLGAVVSAWQAVRATLAEHDAKEQRDTTAAAEQVATQQRDEARDANAKLELAQAKLRSALYTSDMNLIPATWKEENLAHVGELLNRYRPEAGKADLRGFEWHYWNRLSHGALRTVPLPGPVSRAVFSLDGTRLAVAGRADVGPRPGHYLKVLETASWKELFTAPGIPSTITPRFFPFDFSSDGTRIAAFVSEQVDKSGAMLKFQVWDVAGGKGLLPTPVELTMKDVMSGNFNGVTALALSPDGSRVALASCGLSRHEVHLYHAGTGRETVHFAGGMHASNLAFSHDGKWLVGSTSSGAFSVARLWETATGQEHFAPAKIEESWVSQVVFSPDGCRAAVVRPSVESGVNVRDVSTNKELLVIREDLATFPALAFNANGTRLALAVALPGKAVEVQMWDVAAKKRLTTLPAELPAHQTLGNRLVFSPDGERLAGFGYGSTIRVWDAAAGQAPRLLYAHAGGVRDAAFSRDGSRLYSVGPEEIKVWDLTSEVPASPKPDLTTSQIAISRDGERIAQASTVEGSHSRLQVREAGDKELWVSPKVPGRIDSLIFSPNGSRLAAVTSDTELDKRTGTNSLRVWDTATGQELLSRPRIVGQSTHYPTLAFDPDDTQIAVATLPAGEKPDSKAFQIQVWEIITGKELHRSQVFSGLVFQLLFSPDGSRFAAASRPLDRVRTDLIVRVWDAATGKELFTMAASFPSLAFSPDGRRLAVTSASLDADNRPTELKVCGTTTGETLWSEKGSFMSAAFSPDGSRLAAGGNHDPVSGLAEVRVWEAATGRKVFSKKGHASPVRQVKFSPDGRRLASASRQGSGAGIELKLWESTTGDELLSLKREGYIGSLAFGSDGNRLRFTLGSTFDRVNAVEVLDATPLPEERAAQENDSDR